MIKKSKGIILFTVLSLSFITVSVYMYQVFFTPNLLLKQEKGEIIIPKDATVKQVVDTLKKYDYLNDVVSFMFVAKLLKYGENIKYGKYLLSKEMNNLTAIRHLRSGKQVAVRVIFNSVKTLENMAKYASKNIIAQPEQILTLLADTALQQSYGFTLATIKAMFIPNTYQMYYTTTAEGFLERMKREYDNFWTEHRRAKAKAVGLTAIEVAILASIVEEETKKADERPIVAGLYLNRLRKGIKLDADPTVKYALGNFDMRRVLKKHLIIDSPYNTYKYAGLPPGPINIPPIQALDAVLNYQKHDYIYMCAKEDFSGYHNFATNYRQHQRNAFAYRQALNERRIYR